MKIVYMGTPDFAASALEALINSEHTVAAVVTRQDKPKGRSKELQMTPCKELALANDIPVYQPASLRNEEALNEIKKYEPDVIVVAAYGRILPPEMLEYPKYGCVNIHASLLPKYRGAAPIQWAVLDGEEKTGVTIMQMNEGIDTGDILLQKEVIIDKKETSDSLFEKLSVMGSELILEALKELEAGNLVPVPQPEESPTAYSRMITKADGLIDWSMDAGFIERYVRGLNSWPCAYSFMDGANVKLWDAEVIDEDSSYKAGTIVKADKSGLVVQTGKGQLKILELQLQGKKRMDYDAFLRGCRWEAGKCFDEKADA